MPACCYRGTVTRKNIRKYSARINHSVSLLVHKSPRKVYIHAVQRWVDIRKISGHRTLTFKIGNNRYYRVARVSRHWFHNTKMLVVQTIKVRIIDSIVSFMVINLRRCIYKTHLGVKNRLQAVVTFLIYVTSYYRCYRVKFVEFVDVVRSPQYKVMWSNGYYYTDNTFI